MLVLTLRTDKPESEIGLYEGTVQIAYVTWQAHRQLAETIHTKIAELLQDNGKNLGDIQGIVAYQGPGSFTGLRIGLSVANALASSLNVLIVGTSGDDWINDGIDRLTKGDEDVVALPEYGAPVHITAPKK